MTATPPHPNTVAIFAAMNDPSDDNPLRQAVASRLWMLAVRLSATILANRAVPDQFMVKAPVTPLDKVAMALFIHIVESNPDNPKIIIEDISK